MRAMRILTLLMSASALLSVAFAARAETVADRVVQVLHDACVSPTTPEGMIDAGNRIAAAEGWTLVAAGPAPMPMMHNENGPKVSFASGWVFGLPDGSKERVWISILRPEQPGVKHSVCVVSYPETVTPDVMQQALEQRLGALIVQDTKKWNGSRQWFFAEERQRGNCGRTIALFENSKPSLLYIDGAYPNDGKWIAPLTDSVCRS
jgi:hypothetical protein